MKKEEEQEDVSTCLVLGTKAGEAVKFAVTLVAGMKDIRGFKDTLDAYT